MNGSKGLKSLKGLKGLKGLNFSGTGKARIFAADRGCRAMRRPSRQDRSDVRAAQVPLPVALADALRDRPEAARPTPPPIDLNDGEDAAGERAGDQDKRRPPSTGEVMAT